MKLTKNGITYDIVDEIQINAFKNSGWVENNSPAIQNIESEFEPAPRTRRTRITEE